MSSRGPRRLAGGRAAPVPGRRDDGAGAAAAKDGADPGLFGPGSITWRLHSEPVAGVAGLRALLLQALHPLAMAGVDQHSGFREDPWGRLATTAGYVATTTFGTTAQARALGARVRAVHVGVQGTDPETGLPYAASDDDLLLWVHCCLVDSFLSTARRAGVPIDDADADRYVAEQVRAAELVGIPTDRAPASTAGLAEVLAGYRPVLRSSPAARDAVARVLVPPLPPLVAFATPVRPLWASLGALSMALLPAWARRLYALPTFPVTGRVADAAATAALRGLRSGAGGVQRLVPALAEPPALRDARVRLAEAARDAQGRTEGAAR